MYRPVVVRLAVVARLAQVAPIVLVGAVRLVVVAAAWGAFVAVLGEQPAAVVRIAVGVVDIVVAVVADIVLVSVARLGAVAPFYAAAVQGEDYIVVAAADIVAGAVHIVVVLKDRSNLPGVRPKGVPRSDHSRFRAGDNSGRLRTVRPGNRPLTGAPIALAGVARTRALTRAVRPGQRSPQALDR